MNKYTEQLTQWAIEKIKTEYADDVALLIGVPSAEFESDSHGVCFDYFIPATERGLELSRTFILDGIGYDLYGRTWERMERTAALNDPAIPCLADGIILYSRSDEDTRRFEALQKKLTENLSDKVFTYRAALGLLDEAMAIYRTMIFEDSGNLSKMRVAAGSILYLLTTGVAYICETYPKFHTENNYSKVMSKYADYNSNLRNTQSGDELKLLAYNVILSMRKYLSEHKPNLPAPEKTPDWTAIAEIYQEICQKWHRLYQYCISGNSGGAFDECFNIQIELNALSDEYGLEKSDLLGAYNENDLQSVSTLAKAIEDGLTEAIAANGVKLRKYDTIEEFLTDESSVKN
jgi:hypothetical protein